MASRSTRVVYAALAGNALVAASKFGAAGLSGSTAMLTEAIHSLADTCNQVLLLIGQRRGRKPPDASHPFGYGLEVYFWTFVVAIIVFILGGAVSLYEGYRHLLDPHPIEQPAWNVGVLALSFLFEGGSLAVGLRAYRRIVRGRQIGGEEIGLWKFIELSKDPNLYASLLEDSAALIGLGLATAGVLASWLAELYWADGVASLAIGALLVANAFVLTRATRSLMAGESVVEPVHDDLRKALADRRLQSEPEIATLHLGPETILVALTLNFVPSLTALETEDAMREFTARLKQADRRVAYVYARPRT